MAPGGAKIAPRRAKMTPRRSQDGPRRPKRPQEASKTPPRGLQEAPKRLPRGSKRLPRSLISYIKISISRGRGCVFHILPSGVQYVAVRPPPGPRSAGFNPAAAAGRYDQGRSPCRTTLGLICRSSLIRHLLAHAIPPTPDRQITNGS